MLFICSSIISIDFAGIRNLNVRFNSASASLFRTSRPAISFFASVSCFKLIILELMIISDCNCLFTVNRDVSEKHICLF